MVVADRMSDDEVYERTDAYSSTTEDYDNVGFINLEGRWVSKSGGEQT